MTVKGKRQEKLYISHLFQDKNLDYIIAELTALRDDIRASQGVDTSTALVYSEGYYGDDLVLEYWREKNEAERLADEKRKAARKARKQRVKAELEDRDRREYERLVKKFEGKN